MTIPISKILRMRKQAILTIKILIGGMGVLLVFEMERKDFRMTWHPVFGRPLPAFYCERIGNGAV